jgi:hypothetical protein
MMARNSRLPFKAALVLLGLGGAVQALQAQSPMQGDKPADGGAPGGVATDGSARPVNGRPGGIKGNETARKPQPQAKQERDRAEDQGKIWKAHRARDWNGEHIGWTKRGGYKGARIPERRFDDGFGRSHPFRMSAYHVAVVRGHPRFERGGYYFTVLDPWPESWSDDWIRSDDVFLVWDDDGYYLVNPRHPGERLAVRVGTK